MQSSKLLTFNSCGYWGVGANIKVMIHLAPTCSGGYLLFASYERLNTVKEMIIEHLIQTGKEETVWKTNGIKKKKTRNYWQQVRKITRTNDISIGFIVQKLTIKYWQKLQHHKGCILPQGLLGSEMYAVWCDWPLSYIYWLTNGHLSQDNCQS